VLHLVPPDSIGPSWLITENKLDEFSGKISSFDTCLEQMVQISI
jgi:hypothetical protein